MNRWSLVFIYFLATRKRFDFKIRQSMQMAFLDSSVNCSSLISRLNLFCITLSRLWMNLLNGRTSSASSRKLSYESFWFLAKRQVNSKWMNRLFHWKNTFTADAPNLILCKCVNFPNNPFILVTCTYQCFGAELLLQNLFELISMRLFPFLNWKYVR